MRLFLHLASAVRLPVRACSALGRARKSASGTVLFLCAALGLAAPAVRAQPASSTPEQAGLATPVSTSFTFADFDGDHRPDLATAEVEHSDAHVTRYLIRLRLNSRDAGPGQSFGLSGSFGLPQISALDVNGDHVPDLVLTATGQQRPIAVLLNDGRGRFSVARVSDFPSAHFDSPSRWRTTSDHPRDDAVLILIRAPQADASNRPHAFAPQMFAAARAFASLGFVLDSTRSVSFGRAPPLFL